MSKNASFTISFIQILALILLVSMRRTPEKSCRKWNLLLSRKAVKSDIMPLRFSFRFQFAISFLITEPSPILRFFEI